MSYPFWEQVAAGAIVSWPGIAASVWLGTRHVKRYVDRQTSQQTADITHTARDIANDQTRELLGHGRSRRFPWWAG